MCLLNLLKKKIVFDFYNCKFLGQVVHICVIHVSTKFKVGCLVGLVFISVDVEVL